MEIRRCKPGEAATLTGIAHASKRHWGYPERYISAWRDALTLTSRLILDHEVWAAVLDDASVGFYVLIQQGRRMEVEHMWVSPERIGSGVGAALLRHAVELARMRSAVAIDITSDPNAEGFYERMGARRVGWVYAPVAGERRYLPRLELRLAPSHEESSE